MHRVWHVPRSPGSRSQPWQRAAMSSSSGMPLPAAGAPGVACGVEAPVGCARLSAAGPWGPLILGLGVSAAIIPLHRQPHCRTKPSMRNVTGFQDRNQRPTTDMGPDRGGQAAGTPDEQTSGSRGPCLVSPVGAIAPNSWRPSTTFSSAIATLVIPEAALKSRRRVLRQKHPLLLPLQWPHHP